MARAIVFAGDRGKTILIYGLALAMSRRGLKIAYFKPVGIGRRRLPSGSYIDTDAVAVTEALGLHDYLSVVNPIAVSGGYLEIKEKSGEIAEVIESSYKTLSAGRDAVLVETYSTPESLAVVGLSSADIAVMLDAYLALVVDCRDRKVFDSVVDKAILYHEWASSRGARVAGVVFNAVPPTHIDRLREGVVPALEERGVETIGYIPYRPDLLAPRVREIVEQLEAEILEEGEGLDGVVESVVVAAASAEALLRELRRAPSPAVVVSGDRSDLVMQALESKPALVILTGGFYPPPSILSRARERGVPVALVSSDTYTVVERIGEARSAVTASSLRARSEAILGIVENYVKIERLISSAGS